MGKSIKRKSQTRRGAVGKRRKRSTSSQRGKNNSEVTPTGKKAADNLLEAVGGRDHMLEVLADSSNPKAQRLAERMMSSAHGPSETFAQSFQAVGLKAIDIVEILNEVQQAKAFIGALLEGDAVMRSLLRAAKDKVEAHERCNATGYILDRKTGNPTEQECKPCSGTGYMLVSGERDAQQLFFDMISWRKQGGGIMMNFDMRRQTLNQQQNNLSIQGAAPGEAPDVTKIIRRADQQLLNPASSNQMDQMDQTDQMMPEDKEEEIIEAEIAGD